MSNVHNFGSKGLFKKLRQEKTYTFTPARYGIRQILLEEFGRAIGGSASRIARELSLRAKREEGLSSVEARILDDIRWFDAQCNEKEHTDIGEVWDLMNDWRERLEGKRLMFNEEVHYSGALRDAEEKLQNARRAMHEHTTKKKPCEKCAEAEETGYGRAWHCDYYHTLDNRIEKYERAVRDARSSLYRLKEKK